MSVTLESKKRVQEGSNSSKQLRKQGIVPGVVYGLNNDPISVSVEEKQLDRLFKNQYGENIVFDLVVDDSSNKETIRVKSYVVARNAISRRIESVDFIRVANDKLIKSTVPLNLVGNAPGLKLGGTLVQKIREVKIESFPDNIPVAVNVDISSLGLGDFIRIKNLPESEAYNILTAGMEIIVKIATSRGSAANAAGADGSEAGAEG